MQSSAEAPPQPVPTPAAGSNKLQTRLRAAATHLAVSLCIAALAAALVFGVWYPYPYREISSGRELFLIVVCVDVVLGPLLTLVIWNTKKPRSELLRDVGVIGLIQLAALLYGLWTVFVARPVHLVFEYDRFRVIHAIDVPVELEAKMGTHSYPLGRPTPLALRPFKGGVEQYEFTTAALGGTSLSVRPELWQPYVFAQDRVLKAAKPVATLKAKLPNAAAAIDAGVQGTGKAAEDLLFLPMIGRKTFWTVLLDKRTAEPLGFLALDSF